MPTLKTIALSITTAAAVTGGLLLTAGQGEASRAERQTEKRTLDFLSAVEREDLATVSESLHPDIVLTQPMTFSGNQEPDTAFTGHDEALGYFRGMFTDMAEIDFVDIRISVTPGGKVSFVETDGEFTAADGRPYPNVYVFRLEWTPDGRLRSAGDYYNPITVCRYFPENPSCDRASPATAVVTGLPTADQDEASRPERQTEKRTLAFMQAVERTDLAATAEFLHRDIVLTQPMTFDGSQEPILVGTGRDQVREYFRSVYARTPRIDFLDTRISVTHGGKVSFVETKGDFTAADDRTYRNVYVWRLDWTPDGRLLRIADYYNPVILCNTWPENPSCGPSPTAR